MQQQRKVQATTSSRPKKTRLPNTLLIQYAVSKHTGTQLMDRYYRISFLLNSILHHVYRYRYWLVPVLMLQAVLWSRSILTRLRPVKMAATVRAPAPALSVTIFCCKLKFWKILLANLPGLFYAQKGISALLCSSRTGSSLKETDLFITWLLKMLFIACL